MQVYIMRHGEAEGFIGHDFHRDSERPLTTQGLFEAQLMTNWMVKMNIHFNHIFVSPFIRAQQTCAQVLKTVNVDAVTLDFITPEGSAKQVHDFIDGLLTAAQESLRLNGVKAESTGFTQFDEKSAIEPALLIVSHMPLVSYLVGEFTNGEHMPIFATAGIAQIDYDSVTMRGEFVRMVTPLDLC